MKEMPYGKWREYEPADTVRFYALRLYEDGLIKSTPQKILAQGTDWRFFNELKKAATMPGLTLPPSLLLCADQVIE